MQAPWNRVPSCTAAAMSMLLLLSVPVQATQEQDLIDSTRRAAKMIQEGTLQGALRSLDRVLQEDPEYWEAHYQRGRALALLGRMDEALEALLRSVDLNPGFAHGHYLAWLAAFRLEDYDTAWQEAIHAELAGTDMSDNFQQLLQVSPAPDDILERLGAPRILVGPINTEEIVAEAEMAYNRNPNVEENRITQRPDNVQGAFRVGETAAELRELQRQIRKAVLQAPYLGLTLDPGRATMVFQLTVTKLSERSPRQLDGFLDVLDASTGKQTYRRDVVLRDIASVGALNGELDRIVGDMEAALKYKPEKSQ